ncbi:alpha/beta hydrolase [Halieaceae bacterium IMCC14734]|uniref:Alpha/beta hydrolase n=1 Tax=Candidatus Litorirhabdus singularis TaxID=2518993 RepID=A0ABT3TK68_9GAMM|nr:alpha/beta hydrolase [Candidatus Litorirhabdus singularis]MCX2982171.1 alpha/beta hydrolase [Candidatus Litorirhabdus singularis]
MSLDPELVPVLSLLEESGLPDPSVTTPEQFRAAMSAVPVEQPTPVGEVINTVAAGSIPVRIYRPDGEGPFPVLVFYHGGGFVVCDLDTHDEICRQLCAGANVLVVSVQYRLAPEAPFPAPLEDCYAATCWAAENAENYQGLASQLLVAGDSAGANFAAAVSLMARDRGTPAISRQLLIYPVTDFNFETDSYKENAEGFFLTRAMMQWFWGHYLEHPEQGSDPLASPLRAELSGLPPAAVITAGFDPLRDEGQAYARALEAAGVDVQLRHFPGMIHGFVTMAGLTQAAVAVDWLCELAAAKN